MGFWPDFRFDDSKCEPLVGAFIPLAVAVSIDFVFALLKLLPPSTSDFFCICVGFDLLLLKLSFVCLAVLAAGREEESDLL